MSKEKRSFERSPIELAASFGLPEDEQTGQIIDISAGGFCINSPSKQRIGSEIRLAIELDDEERITVTVKVAWCNKDEVDESYRVGVQILPNRSPDFERFYQFYCDLMAQNG